jgi:hypothetical protein
MKTVSLVICFALSVCFQFAFGQSAKRILPPRVLSDGYPDFLNSCEIQNHKKELIYTRLIYSGVEEYWGLTSGKNCNNIIAELEIPEGVILKSKFTKMIRNVHNNYWKTYLIIDVIGTLVDDAKHYGHLGSNNSQFIVKQIIDIQSIPKK